MSFMPAGNGWTCLHVGNTSGPCWQCAPASGICPKCGAPIDDHWLIQRTTPGCRKKAAA